MKRTILTLVVTAIFVPAIAQHEHHHEAPKERKSLKQKINEKKETNPTNRKDTSEQQRKTAPRHEHQDANKAHAVDTTDSRHDHMRSGAMSHAYSLNLPMTRNGSGTGWLPDNSPMYGNMLHSRRWMYMLHGNVFVRYNKQDIFDRGVRGGQKFDAPNWLMAMGQRRIGQKGLFHFSTMFSLDAAVAGGEGYPLLFQSGETWRGQPLVDRQHPHDLFSEMAVSYSYAITPAMDAFIYLGYPGEPSSGSVAFMHRPSALTNPDAPISHHWNDGTHITFGVATLGFRYHKFKIEASSFTGREPDEDRWGFDRPLFDSWSGRLSYNPDRHWALQLSQGFIKSPEVSHPGEDVRRTTASLIYSRSFSKNRLLNATVLWGLNKTAGHDGENAFLSEASYALNRLNIYGRYEWVQKSVDELNLDEAIYGHHAVFSVNAFTAGLSYDVLQARIIRVAAGLQGSLFVADSRLDGLYGMNPMAGQVYLRFYPAIISN